MNLKPFQAVFPNPEYITSADHFMSTVKTDYNEYVASGFFEKSSREGFYVYQIQHFDKKYTGLVACVDIRDYLDGKILKHEHTLATKEQEQIHLLLRRNAQVKPILLTHPPKKDIAGLLKSEIAGRTPTLEIFFEKENQIHRFWQVSEGGRIEEIQLLFRSQVPRSYIADGHHRSAATARMFERAKDPDLAGRFDVLLAAFFATSELEILDFNRVIEGLNLVSPTRFMAELSRLFEIEPLSAPEKPAQKHEITLFINKEWYKLRWRESVLREESDKPVLLDVSLLNEKVLRDILGIEDVRTDARVKYVEGTKGAEGLTDKAIKNEFRVGFWLYPVAMEDFLKIADLGKTLPPKSTWFEPRIKNGLVVKEF
ncbi:MAG: DUF1015 domain-containing protein [Bacteroidetes bacterium]|nr:MAG: DUF1015 domain-containing protein [Bacteroidota bacterium]